MAARRRAAVDSPADRSAALHQASRTWTLYWRDRNLRFRRYGLIHPSANVSELIDEVDRDPTSIFWGWFGRAAGPGQGRQ